MARTKQPRVKATLHQDLQRIRWNSKQLLGGARDGVHHIRDPWRERKAASRSNSQEPLGRGNEGTEQLPRACLRQIIPANHERWHIEYSTDETDEEKIPDMEEGMGFPRQKKTVKLTLPATPSQVHLARSFVEWFAYHGMRPGIRAALVSRKLDRPND